MSVYITMTIFAVLFSALANIKDYKKTENSKFRINIKLVFWYLSELVLIIVAAIRYDVGQDYMYTYVPFFKQEYLLFVQLYFFTIFIKQLEINLQCQL